MPTATTPTTTFAGSDARSTFVQSRQSTNGKRNRQQHMRKKKKCRENRTLYAWFAQRIGPHLCVLYAARDVHVRVTFSFSASVLRLHIKKSTLNPKRQQHTTPQLRSIVRSINKKFMVFVVVVVVVAVVTIVVCRVAQLLRQWKFVRTHNVHCTHFRSSNYPILDHMASL